MIRVAVLAGIVGRVNIDQVRRYFFHQSVGVGIVAHIVNMIVIGRLRHIQLQRFVKGSALNIGVIVPAGIGNLVHRIEKRRNENRPLSLIDGSGFKAALYVAPHVSDFDTVSPAKKGICKVSGHVIFSSGRCCIVFYHIVYNGLRVIFLCPKPCKVTDIIAVHNIIGDKPSVGKCRGHGACSGKNIRYRFYPFALTGNNALDKIKQLVFIAQISSVVDGGAFVMKLFLVSHNLSSFARC